MAQLRDADKQTDRVRFNINVERLGEILAIEAGRYLQYKKGVVHTPFGKVELNQIDPQPILYAIIRAGIQLQNGVRRFFDEASCGFCSSVKNPDGSRTTQLFQRYDVQGKVVIISDPLMTTGAAMGNAISAICANGEPSCIIVLNIITTRLSLDRLRQVKEASSLIVLTCALDDFTVGVRGTLPGLGDAGDLSFGKV